jgi:hypothetical protein
MVLKLSLVYVSTILILFISAYLIVNILPIISDNNPSSNVVNLSNTQETINTDIMLDNGTITADTLLSSGFYTLNNSIEASSHLEAKTYLPSVVAAVCRISPGQCNPNNYVCPLNYDPYCGCDGKTYENYCTSRYIYCNSNSKKGCCSEVDAAA